jgi:hypothetical protein
VGSAPGGFQPGRFRARSVQARSVSIQVSFEPRRVQARSVSSQVGSSQVGFEPGWCTSPVVLAAPSTDARVLYEVNSLWGGDRTGSGTTGHGRVWDWDETDDDEEEEGGGSLHEPTWLEPMYPLKSKWKERKSVNRRQMRKRNKRPKRKKKRENE